MDIDLSLWGSKNMHFCAMHYISSN